MGGRSSAGGAGCRTELNKSQETTCAKREPDVRVIAQPLEAALPALSKSQRGSNRAHRRPQDWMHTGSRGNYAAAEQILTCNCNAAEQSCKERVQNYAHTKSAEKKLQEWLTVSIITEMEKNQVERTLTKVGRYHKNWNCNIFLNCYQKVGRWSKEIRQQFLPQASS